MSNLQQKIVTLFGAFFLQSWQIPWNHNHSEFNQYIYRVVTWQIRRINFCKNFKQSEVALLKAKTCSLYSMYGNHWSSAKIIFLSVPTMRCSASWARHRLPSSSSSFSFSFSHLSIWRSLALGNGCMIACEQVVVLGKSLNLRILPDPNPDPGSLGFVLDK
jgi:hypothetical protein